MTVKQTIKGNLKTVDWRPDPGVSVLPCAPPPEYEASDKDIELFDRNGVVLQRSVFKSWVNILQRGLDKNLSHPNNYAFPCESVKEGQPGRFFDSYCNWHRIQEYRDYIFKSCAASMAGQFMRAASAQLFHEHVFCKEPGTQAPTPWHHDLPYYSVDGFQTVSIYIALDTIPEKTAIRFVRGSHKWDELFFPRHFLDGSSYKHSDPTLRLAPNVEEERGKYDVLVWALEPGDAVLFDFRTLHGTTGATNSNRRRAFSTRWLGDDITYYERIGETSPPINLTNVQSGDRLPEDYFPVLWRRNTE